MKIKCDYITNSSSTSFICLKLNTRELEETVLAENKLSYKKIEKKYEKSYLEDISIKGGLTVVIGEGGDVHYIGQDLDENDLENQTLTQIKDKMVDKFNKVYELQLNQSDLEFDYGEISRGWKLKQISRLTPVAHHL